MSDFDTALYSATRASSTGYAATWHEKCSIVY